MICPYYNYSENSRFDIGPPVQILKELENNVLVLADIEISDDDVPVLARFFSHALVSYDVIYPYSMADILICIILNNRLASK